MTIQLTLCIKHAAQVLGNLQNPTGDCHPKGKWFGERGVIQECDANRGMTPKILEYIRERTEK